MLRATRIWARRALLRSFSLSRGSFGRGGLPRGFGGFLRGRRRRSGNLGYGLRQARFLTRGFIRMNDSLTRCAVEFRLDRLRDIARRSGRFFVERFQAGLDVEIFDAAALSAAHPLFR